MLLYQLDFKGRDNTLSYLKLLELFIEVACVVFVLYCGDIGRYHRLFVELIQVAKRFEPRMSYHLIYIISGPKSLCLILIQEL